MPQAMTIMGAHYDYFLNCVQWLPTYCNNNNIIKTKSTTMVVNWSTPQLGGFTLLLDSSVDCGLHIMLLISYYVRRVQYILIVVPTCMSTGHPLELTTNNSSCYLESLYTASAPSCMSSRCSLWLCF